MHHSKVLDGWRGLAVVLVLIGHVWDHQYGGPIRLAPLGVEFFFVLSGFLITRILLEQPLHDHDLAGFYLRRFFRIFPALAVFVGLAALLNRAGVFAISDVQPGELTASVLFYRNYVAASQLTDHTWSVAVEMHFYLILGLVFFVSKRRPPSPSILIFTAVTGCAVVMNLLFNDLGDRYPYLWESHYRLFSIFLGSLAAFLKEPPDSKAVLPLVLTASALWLAPGLHPNLGMLVSTPLLALAVASVSKHSEGLVHRWLCHPALVYLGTISYSLYLWQQPFLVPGPSFTSPGRVAWKIAGLVSFALASYYGIERPCREWGRRWVRRIEQKRKSGQASVPATT